MLVKVSSLDVANLTLAGERRSGYGAVLLREVASAQALEAFLGPDELIKQRKLLSCVKLFDLHFNFLRE